MGVPLCHLRAFVGHELLQSEHIYLAAVGKHGGVHMPQPVQWSEVGREVSSLFNGPHVLGNVLARPLWQGKYIRCPVSVRIAAILLHCCLTEFSDFYHFSAPEYE